MSDSSTVEVDRPLVPCARDGRRVGCEVFMPGLSAAFGTSLTVQTEKPRLQNRTTNETPFVRPWSASTEGVCLCAGTSASTASRRCFAAAPSNVHSSPSFIRPDLTGGQPAGLLKSVLYISTTSSTRSRKENQ